MPRQKPARRRWQTPLADLANGARRVKVGPLVSKAAIPTLIAAAKLGGSQLRQINAKAREDHDYLTATLTQFKLDLNQGVSDRLLIRSRK